LTTTWSNSGQWLISLRASCMRLTISAVPSAERLRRRPSSVAMVGG
jgi:hypothetical protein